MIVSHEKRLKILKIYLAVLFKTFYSELQKDYSLKYRNSHVIINNGQPLSPSYLIIFSFKST